MIQSRSILRAIVIVSVFANLSRIHSVNAQETPKQASPTANAPEQAASASDSVSIENLPYLIDLRFSVSDDVALDAATASQILADLVSLSERVVGQSWKLDAQWAEGQIWDTAFDLWPQWPEPITYDRKSRNSGEKVWLVRARPGSDPGTLELVGREFDRQSGILGPSRRRSTTMSDLARGIFEICRDIFRPAAEVAGYEGGEVRLRVRGSALASATPDGGVLRPGQYFQLVRLFYERNGMFIASTIEPWTYLKATKVDEGGASCSIISSFRDPIGRKYRQTNKLIAMALTPSETPSNFQFSQLIPTAGTPVRHPVAGYKVEIHGWPDGPVLTSALTDRDGRLSVTPPVGVDFFGVRLVGGSLEPLLDVPVLAGNQVPAILADTKPAAVEFQQRLIAYRDEVLDALARRFVIEARLADRTKASDWTRVAELVREWRSTPIPTGFSSTLAQWKVNAQRRQIQERKPIYTQASQALMAELEALASRYEAQEIDIFEESLEKRSNLPYLQDIEDQAKEKAKASD